MSRTGDRLTTSAVALMATTAVTSVLGLVFWAAAARLFPAEAVGRANAEISAATLLAGFAQLNLAAVLTRFVPGAGARTRWFVARALLVTGAIAVVLTAGFLALGLGRAYLGDGLPERALFVLAVLLFLLAPLTDAAFTALRRAPVVLLQSSVFAVAKLVLLLVVAAVAPAVGVVVAWVAPQLVLLVAATVFLFVVAIPRHQAESGGPGELPDRRRLWSFIAAEYLKSVLTILATLALPLLVAERLGLAATAHFAIPWLVTSSFSLLLYNLTASFVVEAQFDAGGYRRLLRRTIVLGLVVTAGATVVQFAAAPLVLGLLGGDYAAEGTALMRLLALAYPFCALNALYAMFAWLETRLWWLLVLQAVHVVLLVGGTLVLVDDLGLTGVGVAFLVAQAVLGLGSVPPVVRRLRAPVAPAASTTLVPVHHDPDGIALEPVPDPAVRDQDGPT